METNSEFVKRKINEVSEDDMVNAIQLMPTFNLGTDKSQNNQTEEEGTNND